MPCNTDHMEPTVAERQRREAAQHLVYVRGAMGQPVPKDLATDAASHYGGSTDRMKELCSLIGRMNAEQLDRIVYDGRNAQARKLADWWDEHQKEDWKRVEQEAKSKTFDSVLAFARQLSKGGYSVAETALRVSAATGFYCDGEGGTTVYTFPEGIIVLSTIDNGIIAYRGTAV